MSQPMTSDDFNLSLFIKLMKMTTATIDGEALNAVRKANAMLRQNGHDWEDLLKGKITIVNDPFGSIPTPPQARAAPPPQPKPQPPPIQRPSRNAAQVDAWIKTIEPHRATLDHYTLHRFDQIVFDWQHHAPGMTDTDHSRLHILAAAFDPRPRIPTEVQAFFDTCDFAPLSTADSQRVAAIQQAWKRRGDSKMSDRDYGFIQNLHLRHTRPTKGRGKAKRLF